MLPCAAAGVASNSPSITICAIAALLTLSMCLAPLKDERLVAEACLFTMRFRGQAGIKCGSLELLAFWFASLAHEGVGQRHDLPSIRRLEQLHRIHSAVTERLAEMEVVVGPDRRERAAHPYLRVPRPLDPCLALVLAP